MRFASSVPAHSLHLTHVLASPSPCARPPLRDGARSPPSRLLLAGATTFRVVVGQSQATGPPPVWPTTPACALDTGDYSSVDEATNEAPAPWTDCSLNAVVVDSTSESLGTQLYAAGSLDVHCQLVDSVVRMRGGDSFTAGSTGLQFNTNWTIANGDNGQLLTVDKSYRYADPILCVLQPSSARPDEQQRLQHRAICTCLFRLPQWHPADADGVCSQLSAHLTRTTASSFARSFRTPPSARRRISIRIASWPRHHPYWRANFQPIAVHDGTGPVFARNRSVAAFDNA
jgi:hypothetical protein